MPSPETRSTDDALTIIAISALACILQDVLHEAFGHGLTAWLSGAHNLTVSTVALQSDLETRWISANGTLVNLLFGAIFWFVLRDPRRFKPATAYFLIIAMAGNLFTGTGYFLFSGVMNFGDWAAVIRGLDPPWLWRTGLIVLGVLAYYFSMRLVAVKLACFRATEACPQRVRRVSWTPYFTDAILAGLAALLSPLGLFYVIASALPSTLGANAGLLSLPSLIPVWHRDAIEPAGPIRRSVPWIVVGLFASLAFIFVLGRGLSWSR